MSPLISIAMPCYGEAYAKFLPEALESVFSQTVTDWELVLVCDEHAANVVRHTFGNGQLPRVLFFPNGERVRILVGVDPDRGPCDARNRGIAAGTGKLCFVCDADDKIEPTFLEKVVREYERLGSPEYAIVGTDLAEFGLGSGVWRLPDPKFILRENAFCAITLFTRRLWEAADGYDPGVLGFEDWDFWIRCFKSAPVVAGHVPECLVRYRLHEQNYSGISKGTPHGGLWRAELILRYPESFSESERYRARETVLAMPESERKVLRARRQRFPENEKLRALAELVGEV